MDDKLLSDVANAITPDDGDHRCPHCECVFHIGEAMRSISIWPAYARFMYLCPHCRRSIKVEEIQDVHYCPECNTEVYPLAYPYRWEEVRGHIVKVYYHRGCLDEEAPCHHCGSTAGPRPGTYWCPVCGYHTGMEGDRL